MRARVAAGLAAEAGFVRPVFRPLGIGLASLLPGAGQLINGRWWRALFFATVFVLLANLALRASFTEFPVYAWFVFLSGELSITIWPFSGFSAFYALFALVALSVLDAGITSLGIGFRRAQRLDVHLAAGVALLLLGCLGGIYAAARAVVNRNVHESFVTARQPVDFSGFRAAELLLVRREGVEVPFPRGAFVLSNEYVNDQLPGLPAFETGAMIMRVEGLPSDRIGIEGERLHINGEAVAHTTDKVRFSPLLAALSVGPMPEGTMLVRLAIPPRFTGYPFELLTVRKRSRCVGRVVAVVAPVEARRIVGASP